MSELTPSTGTQPEPSDDLVMRINAVLMLTRPDPWTEEGLDALLRYGRKSSGTWDEHADIGDLPHDYDASRIVLMPGLLREALALLVPASPASAPASVTGDLDLDNLEALAKAATPGPWAWVNAGDKGGNAWFVGPVYKCGEGDDGQTDRDNPVYLTGEVRLVAWDDDAEREVRLADYDEWVAFNDHHARSENAAFIAAANPTVVCDLIAEVRRLRAAGDEHGPAEQSERFLGHDEDGDSCAYRWTDKSGAPVRCGHRASDHDERDSFGATLHKFVAAAEASR